MRSLFALLRAHRWYVTAAALVGLAGGAANARLISLTNDELAVAATSASRSAGMFLGCMALAFITGVLSEAMLVLLSERLGHQLRINLCGQIMRLSITDVERLGKSRLTATFTQDIPSIGFALLRIPTVFINGAITIGCLVYLGFLSMAIVGVLGAFLVTTLVSYLLPERRAVRYLAAYRKAWDELIGDFDAMNHGAKELKLHYNRRRDLFAEMKHGSSERVRRTAGIHRVLYAALNGWFRTLLFLFVAVLLYVAPAYATLDLRTLSGFAIVGLYLVGPMDQLIGSMPRFRAADVAFAALRKMGLKLDASVGEVNLLEPGNDPEGIHDVPTVRAITLRSVTHTYYHEKGDRDFILGPIDLTIAAGELVLVTGGNGSGKTSLAKLIAGLYVPASGDLLLNDEPVTAANRERYRQCFSAVFSDFHLFEKLVGGASGELDERARVYLQKLHLDHKVTVQGGRLSTTALSTGQRKRLALLVAYLEDRPIYLFDEWASDQDPEFKDVFYHVLLPELKARGKTIIAITHDDRYFGIADRLLRLRDGQLEAVPQTREAPVWEDGRRRAWPNPPQ